VSNEREINITLHHGDLPAGLDLGQTIAVDSETMGLQPDRDRLCLVQLSAGDGAAHLVQLSPGNYAAPNLRRVLADQQRLKLFHFARFDLGVLRRYLETDCRPVYCTKIASRLVRTYTDRHGLKDLVRDLLGVELDKGEQSSDWGNASLSETQLGYAARDVLYLHDLRAGLDVMLAREGRTQLARACFDFLPTRVALDLAGWSDQDIFAH
jgi:ribonuclease D